MSKDITKIREQLYKMTKNNALSLERYNAHSISVGFKKTGDRETDELAVIFSVEEKKPKHLLKPEEHIPSHGHTFGVSLKTDVVQEPMASIDFNESIQPPNVGSSNYEEILLGDEFNLENAKIDSIPTDLLNVEGQKIQLTSDADASTQALSLVNRVHSSVLSSFPISAYRGFVRPLSGGASSIHHKSSAATLGLIVTDREDGKPVLLSNNHVYGDSIMVGVEALTKGDNNNPLLLSAVQPSNGDYNSRFSEPRDISYYTSDAVETGRVIGRFKRAVPLRTNGQNFVDAAIMEPDPSITLSNNIMFFKHNGPFEFATTAEIDSLLSSGPNLRAPVFRSGRTLGPIGFPGNQIDVTLTRPENIFTETLPFTSIHDTTNAAGTGGLSGINHVELRKVRQSTQFWDNYFSYTLRGRAVTPIFAGQLPAFSQKSQNLISLIKNYDNHWFYSGNNILVAQNRFSNTVPVLCSLVFPVSGDGTGVDDLSTPDTRNVYQSAGYFLDIPVLTNRGTVGLSANPNNDKNSLVMFNTINHYEKGKGVTVNGMNNALCVCPVPTAPLSAKYNDHWSDFPIPFDFDKENPVFTLSGNEHTNTVGQPSSAFLGGFSDVACPVTGAYLKVSDYMFIKKPGQEVDPGTGFPTATADQFGRMPVIFYNAERGQWALAGDPALGFYRWSRSMSHTYQYRERFSGPILHGEVEAAGGLEAFRTNGTLLSALTTFKFGPYGTLSGVGGPATNGSWYVDSGYYTGYATSPFAEFAFTNLDERLNHPTPEVNMDGVMKLVSNPLGAGIAGGNMWMLSAIPESESVAGPGIAGRTGKILTIGTNGYEGTIGRGSVDTQAEPSYGWSGGYPRPNPADCQHTIWTELSGEWLDLATFGTGYLAVKDNGDLHHSSPMNIGLSANFTDRVRDNLNTNVYENGSTSVDLTANVWKEMGKYKKIFTSTDNPSFYFAYSIDYDNVLRWDNFWYESRFPFTKYTYTSAGTGWDTFNVKQISPMATEGANAMILENQDLYYININPISQLRFSNIFKNSASSFWENNLPKDQTRSGIFNFQAVKIAENIHSAAGINHGFDRRNFKGIPSQDSFYYLDTLAFLSGANDEFFITGRNPDNIYANVRREKDSIIVNRLAFNARVNFGGTIGVITIQDNIGIRSAQEQFPCSQGGDSGSAVLALFNPESESLSAWKVIGLVYAGPGAYDNATAIVSRIDRIQEQLHIEPWDGSIPTHQTRTHNVSAITDRQTPLFLTLSGVEFTNIGAPLTF